MPKKRSKQSEERRRRGHSRAEAVARAVNAAARAGAVCDTAIAARPENESSSTNGAAAPSATQDPKQPAESQRADPQIRTEASDDGSSINYHMVSGCPEPLPVAVPSGPSTKAEPAKKRSRTASEHRAKQEQEWSKENGTSSNSPATAKDSHRQATAKAKLIAAAKPIKQGQPVAEQMQQSAQADPHRQADKSESYLEAQSSLSNGRRRIMGKRPPQGSESGDRTNGRKRLRVKTKVGATQPDSAEPPAEPSAARAP